MNISDGVNIGGTSVTDLGGQGLFLGGQRSGLDQTANTMIMASVSNSGTILGGNSTSSTSGIGLLTENVEITQFTNSGTIQSGTSATGTIGSAISFSKYSKIGAFENKQSGVVQASTGSNNPGSAIFLDSTSSISKIVNAGQITGGESTSDTDGGYGLQLESTSTITSIENSGTISGGNSNESYGASAIRTDNVDITAFTNSGTIQSGTSTSGDSQNAIWMKGTSKIGTLTNTGTIKSSNSNGGAALAIEDKSSISLITNKGTIKGSDGDTRAGTGIYFDTNTTNKIVNTGTIQGGYRSNSTADGAGIFVANGKVYITNDGTIKNGGFDATNNPNSIAIYFESAGNTLELKSKSKIFGKLSSDGVSQNLILSNSDSTDNTETATFDLTSLVGSGWGYAASTYTKQGSATWTLTGETPTQQTTNWDIQAGKLIIDDESTVLGTADIASGATLKVGNGGKNGSISGDIANDGTLIFNRSNDYTFDKVISGAGVINKQNTKTLTLNGINTGTGTVTVEAGKLVVGDNSH